MVEFKVTVVARWWSSFLIFHGGGTVVEFNFFDGGGGGGNSHHRADLYREHKVTAAAKEGKELPVTITGKPTILG